MPVYGNSYRYGRYPKRYYTRPYYRSPYKRTTRRISGRGDYRISSAQSLGMSRVRGRGDYGIKRNFFSAPKLGAGLGSFAGSALGNLIAPGIGASVGENIGSRLGRTAGKLFKSITGWGDYKIGANSLVFPDQDVPVFGDDSIRVKHREYIADIKSSDGFDSIVLALNPGLDDTFPWLSSIARNYEQYRFNGMIFQFVSTSADAISDPSNLNLGTVCLATDYNSADADFVNMPQALNSMFANSGKPSTSILHAIECAPGQQVNKLYYVRTGAQPANTDIRLYDIGKFQVCTQGMPGNYTCGQLWVSYDVTFTKSVMNNQLGYAINTDKFQLGPAVPTAPLGLDSQLERVTGSNLGCTIESSTGTANLDRVVFPQNLSSGYYLVALQSHGAATAALNEPAFTTTNCTTMTWVQDATGAAMTNEGSTDNVYINVRVIRINASGAYFTYGTDGVFPGSGTGTDLVITQLNGEIFI